MDEIQSLIEVYKQEKIQLYNNLPIRSISTAYSMILDTYKKNGKIFIFGNGGNAAYAENMAADLSLNPFVSEDKSQPIQNIRRIKAINLSLSPAMITAISNDIGPDHIFSQQLLAHDIDENDLAIGFSGSGNSSNIVQAFITAKEKNAAVLGITRKENGKIEEYCNHVIHILGTSDFPGQTGGNNFNFHYEDSLSAIAHIITGLMKKTIKEM